MNKKNLQKYEKFRFFVTYENALTYALALTEEECFDSNPDKWHEVIYDICQKYRDRVPQLKWIYFTFREPMPPQSEQVDQLIKLLANSREVSLPNPDYPTINMSKEKRELIKKREAGRLAEYQEQLQAISQLLKDALKVA
jgi:hypothetical protein